MVTVIGSGSIRWNYVFKREQWAPTNSPFSFFSTQKQRLQFNRKSYDGSAKTESEREREGKNEEDDV